MVIRNLDESLGHMTVPAQSGCTCDHFIACHRPASSPPWCPPSSRGPTPVTSPWTGTPTPQRQAAQTAREMGISRDYARDYVCVFGDFICLAICADRLADDQLYSEMPYAINCYSSERNRDCYLLHYIIKTDHEFVISYSIPTLDTLLLFMGGLQNLWSHWIIIPHYVSIHISIKHYTGNWIRLDLIILSVIIFPKLTSHLSTLVKDLLPAITFQIQTWGLKIFITTI